MAIKVGDKVRLSGGYDYEPRYLQNPSADYVSGTVLKFIKGQNETQAAVVELNNIIHGNKITGNIVVLKIRHQGDTWSNPTAVHIELCDFMPEDKTWKDRRKGEWIEAAATIRVIN